MTLSFLHDAPIILTMISGSVSCPAAAQAQAEVGAGMLQANSSTITIAKEYSNNSSFTAECMQCAR